MASGVEPLTRSQISDLCTSLFYLSLTDFFFVLGDRRAVAEDEEGARQAHAVPEGGQRVCESSACSGPEHG